MEVYYACPAVVFIVTPTRVEARVGKKRLPRWKGEYGRAIFLITGKGHVSGRSDWPDSF